MPNMMFLLETVNQVIERFSEKSDDNEFQASLRKQFKDSWKARFEKVLKDGSFASRAAVLNVLFNDLSIGVTCLLECEEILKKPEDNTEKMDTGRRILDYHLDAIKIMRDIPAYVGDDNVQSEQEHIHRQADSENITEGFESIND